MFTGIVKEVATIISSNPIIEGRELIISSQKLIDQIEIDDSIAVNGTCQTVTSVTKNSFTVQAVSSTLAKTTLGKLTSKAKVNLELALRPIDRLGGHFVSGHINAVTQVKEITKKGKNIILKISIPINSSKYIVKEGSITIDGVSLTISEVSRTNNDFTLSIIPHTWNNTTLTLLKKGSSVNIEFDLIAKYIENLLFHNDSKISKEKCKINQEWLLSKGF